MRAGPVWRWTVPFARDVQERIESARRAEAERRLVEWQGDRDKDRVCGVLVMTAVVAAMLLLVAP